MWTFPATPVFVSPARPVVPSRMLTANGPGPAVSPQQTANGSGGQEAAAVGPASGAEELLAEKKAGPETGETDNMAEH